MSRLFVTFTSRRHTPGDAKPSPRRWRDPLLPMGEGLGVRGAGARASRRGRSPLLKIVIIIALTILTACTGSSAATQPPATKSAPAIPTPTSESEAELPQVSPGSLETPTPMLTPTALPSATPRPLPSATPSPTATPAPSLRQLTGGGCCVQPFFSADGRQVLFIDKPGADAPVGIYGVDLANPQPTPFLENERIGFRNPDRTIVATLDGSGLAHFLDEASGQSWSVDTGGNPPHFSPDSSRILWTATDLEGPYDQRQSDIWLADLDGSNPRRLLSVRGGGVVGWFPDGQQILLIDRENPGEEELTLSIYNVDNGRRTDLFTHKRLRGADISPGGSWIVFFLAFADEPADNGIWVISADGAARQKLALPGFGAFRWRDDNTLLYIPMRASSEESMQLWAVDVRTGQLQPLTNPTSLSFSISNGDWDVSPDGRYVVFVSSADQNIWLITLP